MSCTPKPNERAIQTAIAETLAAQDLLAKAKEVLTEENVNLEPKPTNTPRPTNTAIPTEKPIPTNTATTKPNRDTSLIKAKNYLVSKESNGVIVEVARVIIGEKQSIINGLDFDDINKIPIMDDKVTIIEFIFRIVNNSDKVIRFFFKMKTIASVNSEQIVFDDYWRDNNTWFGDDLQNQILPGATVIGGLWTGVKRSPWNEISTITIPVPNAFDHDNYRDITGNFLLSFDVNDWDFEELPDELK